LNKIIFELNNLLDGMNKNEDEINVKSICNKSNNEIDTSDYHLKTELFYDLGETLQLAKNVSSGSLTNIAETTGMGGLNMAPNLNAPNGTASTTAITSTLKTLQDYAKAFGASGNKFDYIDDLDFKNYLKDDNISIKNDNNSFTREFNKVFPKFFYVEKNNESEESLKKNVHDIYLAKLEKVTILQKLIILW